MFGISAEPVPLGTQRGLAKNNQQGDKAQKQDGGSGKQSLSPRRLHPAVLYGLLFAALAAMGFGAWHHHNVHANEGKGAKPSKR